MKADQTNDEEALALGALSWTLGDDTRASRLVALTGLTPVGMRERLADRDFLAEVLRFVEAVQALLIAAAERAEAVEEEALSEEATDDAPEGEADEGEEPEAE